MTPCLVIRGQGVPSEQLVRGLLSGTRFSRNDELRLLTTQHSLIMSIEMSADVSVNSYFFSLLLRGDYVHRFLFPIRSRSVLSWTQSVHPRIRVLSVAFTFVACHGMPRS